MFPKISKGEPLGLPKQDFLQTLQRLTVSIKALKLWVLKRPHAFYKVLYLLKETPVS